jgi:N-formylglutamate amidohydrolase
VLSVPHAGRDYSPLILSASRLTRQQLESLEDRFVDRLVEQTLCTGAVAVIARRPRAEIDLNRDEREIDPTIIDPPPPARNVLPTARSRGGLGLIPARVAGAGPIWQQPIDSGELHRRITQIHRPYHAALAEALEQARDRFGVAVLIDCHSMPPRMERKGGQAEIIFGDLHGTTIAEELLDAAVQAARIAGFRTACNAPYAGGYVIARHGRPASKIHAVQIEIDRSLYLCRDLHAPAKGFDRVADLLTHITAAIAERTAPLPNAIAAE